MYERGGEGGPLAVASNESPYSMLSRLQRAASKEQRTNKERRNEDAKDSQQ
jgi:hypothetical protein